jgi:heptosyltransferase-1
VLTTCGTDRPRCPQRDRRCDERTNVIAIERNRFGRILIIKPSSLGDIVDALPVLAELRRAYPRAHIAWLTNTEYAGLLDGHPYLDEVIPFDRRRFGRLWRQPAIVADLARVVAFVRGHEFDLVLDLQGLLRSALLSWVSGARVRVGFADARELAPLFYTHRVRCPPGVRHAVDRNLSVVRTLGIAPGPAHFELGLRPEEREAARRMLAAAAGRPLAHFCALLPGARWESKRWPARRWAELIGLLQQEGHECVLLGAPEDRAIGHQIQRECAAAVVSLVGCTTLRQLAALLDLAQCVICQDSGPMHIAAALGRPVLALFGPTSAMRTGPYGPLARVVSRPIECAPCYRRICPLKHQACLKELTAAQVACELRALLEQTQTTSRQSQTASAAVHT